MQQNLQQAFFSPFLETENIQDSSVGNSVTDGNGKNGKQTETQAKAQAH